MIGINVICQMSAASTHPNASVTHTHTHAHQASLQQAAADVFRRNALQNRFHSPGHARPTAAPSSHANAAQGRDDPEASSSSPSPSSPASSSEEPPLLLAGHALHSVRRDSRSALRVSASAEDIRKAEERGRVEEPVLLKPSDVRALASCLPENLVFGVGSQVTYRMPYKWGKGVCASRVAC